MRTIRSATIVLVTATALATGACSKKDEGGGAFGVQQQGQGQQQGNQGDGKCSDDPDHTVIPVGGEAYLDKADSQVKVEAKVSDNPPTYRLTVTRKGETKTGTVKEGEDFEAGGNGFIWLRKACGDSIAVEGQSA